MICTSRKLVIASFLAFFTTYLSAQNFVLDNKDSLLVDENVAFIQRLGQELFDKSGFSLAVAVVDSIAKSSDMQNNNKNLDILDNEAQKQLQKQIRESYKQSLVANLSEPYALIFFIKNDKKMGIISSAKNKFFNEDRVYDEYMQPFLPKQKSEILDNYAISRIISNGYIKSAELLAKHYSITLEENVPADEQGAKDFVHYAMQVMLIILLSLIAMVYFTSKKGKKQNEKH